MNSSTDKKGLFSSFSLHILAMALMLCDHLWATMFPYLEWMTCIGRIAFPIFAFMIAEGFYYTRNRKKYLLRMFIFALISEIPFNLIMTSSWINPFHQNVLFTFCLGILFMMLIEKIKTIKTKSEKGTIIVKWLLIGLVFLLSMAVGLITFVDYFAIGVATVLVFYLFREKTWYNLIIQIVLLYWLNFSVLGGYGYDLSILGFDFFLAQQGIAIFALIPIWLYNGRQGYHKKWFQYFCYGFYPGHLLILYIVWKIILNFI